MGSIIGADAWLETLARSNDRCAAPAVKLLRMQILVANRTGHRVPLQTEYLRRRIVQAARWGHIAAAYATCELCGTQATLVNWFDSGELKSEERAAVLAEDKGRIYKESLAYLRPCPGPEYAADIAFIDTLPAREERA